MTEQKKLPADFWDNEADIDPFAIEHEAGAELNEIEPHQAELTDIVEKMKEDLLTETRIIEGTEIPEREVIDIPMCDGESSKNEELSTKGKDKE